MRNPAKSDGIGTPPWTPNRNRLGLFVDLGKIVVGLPRFELGTSCTPSKKYQSLIAKPH